MSEAIGALRAELSANAAQFASDMGKAKDAVRKNAQGMSAAMDKVRDSFEGTMTKINRFGAVAAIGAATGISALIKKSIDSAEELNKMSQQVGISTESLSTLQFAAELSEVSLEQLGNGLIKLSKNAAEAANGTGTAKDAFNALHIELKNQNGTLKTSEELLLEIASKFKGLSDGTDKTALAMKLFGKSGAELITLLNQGADGIKSGQDAARGFGLELSTNAAQAADEFNDKLTELKWAGKGLARNISIEMLPMLTEIVNAMHEANREGGLLLALWTGLGGLGRAVFTDKLSSEEKQIQNKIDAAEKKLAALKGYTGPKIVVERDIPALEDYLKNLKELQTAMQEQSKLKAQLAGEKKKAAADGQQAADEELRKTLEGQKAREDAAKKAKTEAEQRQKQGESAILNLEQEIQKTGELSREELMRWEITKGQYKDLSAGQKERLMALAAEYDAVSAVQKANEELKKQREAIDEQNKSLREQAETFGMTERQATLYKMKIDGATDSQLALADSYLKTIETQEKVKKLLEEIKTPQQTYNEQVKELQTLLNQGAITWEQYNAGMTKAKETLEDANKKGKEDLKELQQAIEGWGKDSADAIVDFCMEGKTSFKDMVNSMIKDMLRMMVYQNITKPLAGWLSGVAGNIFGGSETSSVASSSSGVGVWTAKGNAFNRGNVIPFARGGIVNKPTFFPMAHGMGVMGEAGPEAVMPLKRASNGSLGIEVEGIGATNVISIPLTVNGANKQQAAELREEIENTVQRVIKRWL